MLQAMRLYSQDQAAAVWAMCKRRVLYPSLAGQLGFRHTVVGPYMVSR